jgi:hypothetical protein
LNPAALSIALAGALLGPSVITELRGFKFSAMSFFPHPYPFFASNHFNYAAAAFASAENRARFSCSSNTNHEHEPQKPEQILFGAEEALTFLPFVFWRPRV